MSGIKQQATSRRSPVLWDQAQLFTMLTRDLIQAYMHHMGIELDEFYALPEYDRFVIGAYACGFVCRDYAPMDGELFEQMKSRPQEHLATCSFNRLRHWTHTLLRSERWNYGYSSPVMEALDSGSLELLIQRLETDNHLIEPEIIEDTAGKAP
ncbi:hypothetical protein [Azotobacter beijerinckii]|uniref:hypothetical protein n=1 Tax=Azotobacter beijerinckii TaxID=170623 RepID=UPI0029544507|nr:hypothetical protein [Azotobacter beijerinckii]MDV7210774.1 hypothetical protein [Azotobacter beijerinckii]